MFGKNFLRTIVILGFVLLIASLRVSNVSVRGQSVTEPANSIWLDPGAVSYDQNTGPVGTLFNVTAYTNVNVSSFTWQVKMLFNNTLLQCVAAGYTNGLTGSKFFAGHSTVPVTIDLTQNVSVTAGETLLGADSRPPGNGSLAWFEFKILAVPYATYTPLACLLDISNPGDNYVLDTDLNTVASTNYSATYTSTYNVVPEFASVLIILVPMAGTSAALLTRKKMAR